MNVQGLTIRQMQIYAALCFKEFCRHFRICHPAIDELIEHLIDIGTAQDLPKWDLEGRKLAITGRGDDFPSDVVDAVPNNLLNAFSSLVELSVEVGIIDMYGDPSESPADFLKKCLDILAKHSVAAPNENGLRSLGAGFDSWGSAVNEADLSNYLQTFDS
jgi:hypothetical protein